MMRLAATSVLLLVGASASADSSSRELEPLVIALADARAHAASLAEHAGTAPPAALNQPSDDEKDALAAVVAADQALNDLTHASPTALPRMVDTQLLSDLNGAHAGLAAFAQARTHGNRRAMRAAAENAVKALDRADARLDPLKPYHIMQPE
jgi:hypothetical protein